MTTITPLDRLLFDPLSWMHPQRLPLKADFDGARQRRIINDMIIEACGWSTEKPVAPSNGLARYFVGQWIFLPQVALLMACQRHRASLSRQGRLLTLPLWLRSFAELNIVDACAAAPVTPDISTLLAWGKHDLIVYSQHLPVVMRQRISLLFSSDMDREQSAYPQINPGSLLIKLAFQHAERHPDTPDTAEFRRRFDQAHAVAATTPEPGFVDRFTPPGG